MATDRTDIDARGVWPVLLVAVLLGSASCSEESATPVEATVATARAFLTPDLSNERIEGSFTLAIAAADEGDGAALERFDLTFSGTGTPLTNLVVETDGAYPIFMKPGTQARVQYRFAADSPLPPPPQLTGWCASPAFILPFGVLIESAESGGASHAVEIPALTAPRTAVPEAADVGAVWAAPLQGGAKRAVGAVAVDAAGNTLMSMRDVSNGLAAEEPFYADQFSPLLTKLDAAGDTLWTRDLDGAGELTSAFVAAGADVEIVAGTFDGPIDLGAGLVEGDGARDIYVARLDAEGSAVWSRLISSQGLTLSLHGLEVDASGNTVIAGSSYGGVPVQIGEQTIVPVPSSQIDALMGFLVVLDPSGEVRFAQSLASVPSGLAVDASGAIVLAGSMESAVTLGGLTLGYGDDGEFWIEKLDGAGQEVWREQYAATGEVTALELGPGGEIHLTVHVDGASDFGGGSLGAGWLSSLVVVKLDPEGGHVWSQRFADGPRFNERAVLAVDGAGRIFLSGAMSAPVQFGDVVLPSGGEGALFAAQLDPSGGPIHAGFFGCSDGLRPAFAYRSGVSEGVILAAPFRTFVALGGEVITSSGQNVAIAGFGP